MIGRVPVRPNAVRRLARPLAAVALLLGLACAPAAKDQPLVFWQFFPAEVVRPILDRFEQEHPGIKVRMEQLTWDNGLQKITAAIAAGNVPDLCEIGSTWMPRMIAAGALADWSAGVADLKPALVGWGLCSIGDASYGVPWAMGTRALFYNKTLFARAGLDSTRPPQTWDELYAAAEAIHKLGGGVHGYGVQAGQQYVLFKKFMPYAWGNGGRILSDDLSKSEIDSPRNREALEFYLRLRPVGMLGQQDALDKEFKEGRLGLQISGAWLFRSIPRDAPTLRYGVALVPRPAEEHGTHASFAGGEVLASFNASKNKQQALELARFLVRPDNAIALAQAVKSVQPANVGADTAAYYREHPEEQVMLRQFETAVPPPNHPSWVEMEDAIEKEIELALYDRKTAAQALADASLKVDALAKKK